MIEFKFSCPHCGTHILCEAGYTGWQINCPACKQALVVPAPGMAAPAAAPGAARPPAGQSSPAPAAAVAGGGQQSSGLALAALLLSILGLPGIICGHIALGNIKQNPRLSGKGAALAGLIIGYIVLAAGIAVGVMAGMHVGPFKAEELPPIVTQKPENQTSPTDNKPTTASPGSTKSTSSSPMASAVWMDNFETGLEFWTPTPGNKDNPAGASGLTKGASRTISGTSSAKVSSSSDKMYHDVGFEITGQVKLTFWLYDDTQTRVFGELRAYSKGHANDSLHQILSIGRYDIKLGNVTGILKEETVDKTKYQGRILAGSNTGWFNLDAPGAPARSPGWHKFEIERTADGKTVNFYVDGILGRSIPDSRPAPINTIEIGSLGTGAVSGTAWFDDVKLEYFAPASEIPANSLPKKKSSTTTTAKKPAKK
jgi:hypothetical protein